MRKIIFFTILCLMLLSACGTKPEMPAPTTPSGAIVAQEKQTMPVEEELPVPAEKETIKPAELPPAPAESKIVVEKSRQFSPELRDLLQKADNEVKSVTYLYAESPDNIGFDTYILKGTKMKILLFEKNDYVIDDYFNAVYLDTTTKTAKGKCENKKRCISQEIDNTKRVYDLNYDTYRKKTAYEWIKSVEFAEIEGFETLNNHAVTKIKTNKNGVEIEMWVDSRFGLPHKIKVTKSDDQRTYYFKNMMFNGVKDTDVLLK